MSHPLDALFAQISGESDEIAAVIAEEIASGVGNYTEFPVPRDQLLFDIRRSIEGIIAGVRTHHLPSPDAIEHARTMGRQRARYGLPLHQAIAGYHLGYRTIWNRMLTLAEHQRPDLTAELAHEVTLLWDWFQGLSSAFSDAHVDESQSLLMSQLAAAQRLVRTLLDESAAPAQRDELLTALGFDPQGEFMVICVALGDDPDVAKINETLAGLPGRAHSVSNSTEGTVIVTQEVNEDAAVNALHSVFHGAPVAVGMRRSGSAGAALSLGDALEGIEHAAQAKRTVRYETDWLVSLVSAQGIRLHGLLEIGVLVAAANPNVAETVRVYLESRQSTATCAKTLFLHANSVKYRLERWGQLTGWDLRTVDGMVRSTLALELAAAPDGAWQHRLKDS